MGGGIRCIFKEKNGTIITREDSLLFGHVGRVLDYTSASQVILHVRGEPEIKLVSFFDA
jgi:hypothetical protein